MKRQSNAVAQVAQARTIGGVKSLEDEIEELLIPLDYAWLKADDEFARLLLAVKDTRDARNLIQLAALMLAARLN